MGAGGGGGVPKYISARMVVDLSFLKCWSVCGSYQYINTEYKNEIYVLHVHVRLLGLSS
jgi:hypothetical protein